MQLDRSRLREWIRVLEQAPSGRLMLTNVYHAFRTGRPSHDQLVAFFETLVVDWQPDTGRRADTIVAVIVDNKLPDLLFVGETADPVPCSRVVDAKSMVLNNIDPSVLAHPQADEIPERLLRNLEEGLVDTRTIRTGMLSGRRPFAWVTQTTSIEQLRQLGLASDELASQIRDRLGLGGYGEDQMLIEIEYPQTVLESLDLHAPTFFEGGAGVIFRADSGDDHWGRAVDLATHLRGLPEAVHKPIPFDERFRVRRIGRINRAPGHVYEAIVQHAPHSWPVSDIPPDFDSFVEE